MREGSAKKNSNGKSRNERTNINMEGVTLETKVKLVNVFVLPIVLYGADEKTREKGDRGFLCFWKYI